LLAAAEHEHADGDDHDHAESCCTAATTHTTTCSTPAGACASCDESHAAEKQSDARPRWRLVVVIGRMVGHCRGLGPLSVLTFSALPPVAAVNYRFDWRPTGWLAVPLLCASSIALDIPTRPPCA
jgi:ABC-type nickel/cobalt efflux system permease component RcnA